MTTVRKKAVEWFTIIEHLMLAYIFIYVFIVPVMYGTVIINIAVTIGFGLATAFPLAYTEIFSLESMTDSRKKYMIKNRNRAIAFGVLTALAFLAFCGTYWYSAMLEGSTLIEAIQQWQVPAFFALYVSIGVSIGTISTQSTLISRLGDGTSRR